jgi:hypothetical protein
VEELSKKQLLKENRVLKAALENERKENALLRQKVDLLIRKVFGASSEKLDASQLDLFLLQTENAPGKPVASSLVEEADPPRARHRPSPKERHLPDNLPVVEEVIDPEEVKEAPQQWRCIVQDGTPFPGLGFADEQPVFLAESRGPDRVLDHVLIDLDASVIEVNTEQRPEVERVVEGQAHSALGQVASGSF